MILGLTAFTFVHVVLSLAAIVAGFFVLYGLIAAKAMNRSTLVFVVTMAATLATGFLLPFDTVTPAVATGIIASLFLILAIVARYRFRMSGYWRGAYVLGAVIVHYLNVFVLVVQSFQKVPALNALAPTGSEPPFAITQGIVLALFVVAAILAVRRFRPGLAMALASA